MSKEKSPVEEDNPFAESLNFIMGYPSTTFVDESVHSNLKSLFIKFLQQSQELTSLQDELCDYERDMRRILLANKEYLSDEEFINYVEDANEEVDHSEYLDLIRALIERIIANSGIANVPPNSGERDYEVTISELRQELAEAQQIIQSTSKDLGVLRANEEECNFISREMERKIFELQDENAKLQSELSTTKHKQENEAEEYSIRISAFEDRERALIAKLETSLEQTKALRKQSESQFLVVDDYERLTSENSQMAESISELKKENKILQSKVKSFTLEIKELTNKLLVLTVGNSHNEMENEKTVALLTKDNNELSSQLEFAEKEIKNLKSDIQALSKKKKSIIAPIDTVQPKSSLRPKGIIGLDKLLSSMKSTQSKKPVTSTLAIPSLRNTNGRQSSRGQRNSMTSHQIEGKLNEMFQKNNKQSPISSIVQSEDEDSDANIVKSLRNEVENLKIKYFKFAESSGQNMNDLYSEIDLLAKENRALKREMSKHGIYLIKVIDS